MRSLPAHPLRGRAPIRASVPFRNRPQALGQKYTKRDWAKDRSHLDLHRPLPHGSVSVKEMQRIDHGLFFAWNRLQLRWEVWCRRDGERQPPYFVMRVITHPKNIYDSDGLVKSSCPGRPARSRNARECPPSCRGKYEIPDRRVLTVLYKGSVKHRLEMVKKLTEEMERREDAEVAARERHASNELEALVSDKFNRIAGVEQVGYTGKEWS